MKKWAEGILLTACFLVPAESVHAYSENEARDRGRMEADRNRQQNDENIKRAQGDEGGIRSLHEQGIFQNDDRGRW